MKIILLASIALAAVVNAAGLDFAETLKEIHAPADVDRVTADFEFTNKTNKPVRVVKYDAACSCMAVTIRDGKLQYAPGESGLIRAVFEMGNFTGSVDKVVALWLDDDPADKPSVSLTVRVHIPVLVSVEPKTLKWELNGEASPQIIRITMKEGSLIRVKGVTSSIPAFQPELKTIEEGKSYELLVTPTAIQTPGLGIIRIETDAASAKHRLHQAFAVVRKMTPAEAAAAKP
jgi:Protein of unknown function (DUF1573)